MDDYTEADASDESNPQDQADESSSSDQGYMQGQGGGGDQGEEGTNPNSVTYAEAQTEPDDEGDEVTLSDDDIAAILQEAGVSDDEEYA